MKVRRLTAVAAVSVVALAACGGGNQQATKPKPKPPTTTTTVPVPTAPFTGLPDPSGVTQTRPSLAVKIENTPEARPQSGLDVADVVYEEVVDGGITRFWALFNSAAPANIGPVRSVRAMDPMVVKPLGGVIAYSGGTVPNVALIRATGLVWVDENNAADSFFRERTRSAPHNLYGRSDLLFKRGGTPVPPMPLFSYLDKGATFTGEPVTGMHLNYDQGYDVTYQWDATANGWKRFQRTNEPFMAVGSTGFTPVQVAPTNVIVMFVPYAGAGEGNLIGSGDAWIFSNGQLVKGRWAKPSAEVAATYTDAAGVAILLTRGRTWVELLPTGRTVDVAAAPVPPPTTTTTTTTTTTKKKKKKK